MAKKLILYYLKECTDVFFFLELIKPFNLIYDMPGLFEDSNFNNKKYCLKSPFLYVMLFHFKITQFVPLTLKAWYVLLVDDAKLGKV